MYTITKRDLFQGGKVSLTWKSINFIHIFNKIKGITSTKDNAIHKLKFVFHLPISIFSVKQNAKKYNTMIKRVVNIDQPTLCFLLLFFLILYLLK